MFSYYNSLSRRRSSNSNPQVSPSLPVHSPTLNGSDAHSPQLAPLSPPSSKRSPGGDLGSPFSITNHPLSGAVSANAYGYGFTNGGPSHRPSLPVLSEAAQEQHDRDMDLELDREYLTSGGSRAPLVARDFGMDGTSHDTDGDGQTKQKQYPIGKDGQDRKESKISNASRSSDTFRLLPGDDSSLPRSSMDASGHPIRLNQPPLSRATDDPSLVPPPSVHDTYVSRHVQPIAPPSPSPDLSRPGLNRSSSAPGHPHSGLLPSVLPQSSEKPNDTNQPVFQIFDANLTEDGTDMSKKLRGYLEVVLKGQEQVGKMHLELEGLNMGDDTHWDAASGDRKLNGAERADLRESGVDEIMKRLDELSDTLRDYHQLGTPKMTFPRQPSRSATDQLPTTPGSKDGAKSRTQSHGQAQTSFTDIPATDLSRAKTFAGPPSPEMQKRHEQGRPRAPSLARANTALGQVSPQALKERMKPGSPLVNTFKPPSPFDDEHVMSANGSDSPTASLNPTGLTDSAAGGSRSIPFVDSSPESKMKKFWDRDAKDGGQGWLEDVLGRDLSPPRKSGNGEGKRERNITDSPTDMSFSSRW